MALPLFLTLLLVSASYAQGITKAIAVIQPQSSSSVAGYVMFEMVDGMVHVNATLSGLGVRTSVSIHVHTFGDLTSIVLGTNDALTTGGHYWGSGSSTHGCPPSLNRHAGDMGNFMVMAGNVSEVKSLNLLEMTGMHSIIGRAVVVHDLADSCTGANGNAGSRIGFGVIGLWDDATNMAKNEDPTVTTAVAVTSLGPVWFNQVGDNLVSIVGRFSGAALTVGSAHGLHIHNYGNLWKASYAGAGSHWNTDGSMHGFPTDAEHHMGDLGNLQTYVNADGWYKYIASGFKVHEIVGRILIVHASFDHGAGHGCDQAGTSGPRMAGAVIGVQNTDPLVTASYTLPAGFVSNNQWTKVDCTTPPIPQVPEPEGPAEQFPNDYAPIPVEAGASSIFASCVLFASLAVLALI